MPVTIGEFEVVNEPAPQAPATAPAPPSAAPDPLEIQRLLAELHELALRTWSH